MNPFKLLHNYRKFKANNRYSYPFLFFVVSAAKNLFQWSALGIAGWAIFQLGSGFPGSVPVVVDVVENVSQESVALPAVVQQPASNDRVEVLAVDNRVDTRLVSQNVKSAPVATRPLSLQDADRVVSWEWILKQDDEKFTIQFGSSPDKDRLYKAAYSFPTMEAVAVFPFKKTPSNRTVYGFASGLYNTLESAQLAIGDLSEDARAHGPWIRPISALKKEIVVTLAK